MIKHGYQLNETRASAYMLVKFKLEASYMLV